MIVLETGSRNMPPGGPDPAMAAPAVAATPGLLGDARITAAFDVLLDAVAIFAVRRDPVGRLEDASLLYANPVWLAWFAACRPLALLLDRSLYEVLPELGARRALHARVVETGEPFRGTVQVGGTDGPRVIDLFVGAYGDGIISSSRDVTAEQEARRALVASEEQLRRTLDGIDAIVTYRESRAKPLSVSPQFERILGYRAEQAVEDGFWNSLVHPEDVARCEAVWHSQATEWDLEYRMRRADGTWTWVLDRARNTQGPDGLPDALFSVVVDVTERHEAAERLAESERAYRLVAENSSDVVFRGSPVGAVEWVSPSVTALVGWLPDEMVGRSFADFVHPEDRPRLSAAQQHMAAGEAQHYELRILTSSGELHWVGVSARPVRDDTGAIVARVGSWRDIHAEVASREALRRLATAVEETDESIVITDADAAIAYVNPAFERVTGYTRAEAIGQNPRILQGSRRPAGFYQDMWSTLTAGRTWRGEFVNRRKDGTLYTEDATITGVRGPDGSIVSYVAVKRDVSDQRAVLAILARSRAELAEAQRVAHLGSWTLDAATGSIEWSDELLRIYGIEAGGSTPTLEEHALLLEPVMRVRVHEKISTALATGDPYELEYELIHPDGTRRYLLAHGEAVHDEGGSIIGLRGTATDVTERRSVADQLARATRLESLARLASGVAHDFDNLLFGISVLAGSVEAGASDEQQRTAARRIVEAVAAGRGMTRQLDALSGGAPERRVPTDLAGVFGSLADVLPGVLGPAIDLRIAIPDSLPPARIAPLQLQDVLLGIVAAARDAMVGGGRFTVSATSLVPGRAEATRAGLKPGSYLRIDLGHTGRAIPRSFLAHAFEPFSMSEPENVGTGLRLPLAAAFASSSGGGITVDSEPGLTTFHLYLPAA
jgi:PAS domain S-box-containing protein